MRKFWTVLAYFLVGLSLVVLFIRFGVKPITNYLGYQPRAGLKVTSNPQASIYLNNQQIGQTPYEDHSLAVGKYQIRIGDGEAKWEGSVNLNSGVVTVVNRDLPTPQSTSSGEVLTLDTGKGVVISSNPADCEVEIDGKVVGKTPLSLYDLPVGEHVFIIRHDDFLARSVKAYLPEDKTLTMDIDLSAMVAPAVSVTPPPVITPAKALKVSGTPNGFLRVRAKPSTTSAEIGRINEGETVNVIEQSSDWYKIKLDDGKVGYVSSQYVTK